MAKIKDKTQLEMVLEHLMTGQAITPLDALHNYGCFRLAAVVHNLRDMGINVVSEMVSNGEKRFASYELADAEMAAIAYGSIKSADDYIAMMKSKPLQKQAYGS